MVKWVHEIVEADGRRHAKIRESAEPRTLRNWMSGNASLRLHFPCVEMLGNWAFPVAVLARLLWAKTTNEIDLQR